MRAANRKRHQLIIVTLISLQTELHPDKVDRIRKVMASLFDDGKEDSP